MARKNEHGARPRRRSGNRQAGDRPPPLYSVILLNDDYTPMDFVVDPGAVLRPDVERATQVMLHVHTRGRGVCGVFSREVVESKVAQVNEYSRMNQHPLPAPWKRRKREGQWKSGIAAPIQGSSSLFGGTQPHVQQGSRIHHRPVLQVRPPGARRAYMTVEHLLLSLLDNPSAEAVLKACGVDFTACAPTWSRRS